MFGLWAEVLVSDRSDLFLRLRRDFALNVFEVEKAHRFTFDFYALIRLVI